MIIVISRKMSPLKLIIIIKTADRNHNLNLRKIAYFYPLNFKFFFHMKKTLLLLTVSGFLTFFGCKNNTDSSPDSATQEMLEEDRDHLSDAESHHNKTGDLENSWLDEIKLDEGKLWMANPETITGVERMRKNIHTTELSGTESYKALAEKLNEDKNYIVKECTMEGASHDNLHIWLHPLIEKIESLSKVESANEGQILVNDIEERLTRFYDYFK